MRLSRVHSFVRSSIRSFVCLFAGAFIYSFVRSLIRLFIRLFVCSFARSFVHSFIRSFVRSFIRSFARSFARSFVLHSDVISKFTFSYGPMRQSFLRGHFYKFLPRNETFCNEKAYHSSIEVDVHRFIVAPLIKVELCVSIWSSKDVSVEIQLRDRRCWPAVNTNQGNAQ